MQSVAKAADKPLVWLHGEIKTPPFSREGRIEAGILLRRLQRGENLSLPHSRPMVAIGVRCHELRVPDRDGTWADIVPDRSRRCRDCGCVQQEDSRDAA